ncbi:UNVERIFIED_CONTAM: hypothetical protein Slati_1530800 [Sesamum latifolium]|uniref:Uncharacterized protein n=1 Tax=Sesamum latifolium TaxID=2727402 RepID=A0AAW2X942_9LAMI
MPAVAIPGASVPTHPTYFARAQGGGMMTLGALHPSMSLSSSWPLGGTDQYGNQPTGPYGLQPASNWPSGSISDISYASQKTQLPPGSNGYGEKELGHFSIGIMERGKEMENSSVKVDEVSRTKDMVLEFNGLCLSAIILTIGWVIQIPYPPSVWVCLCESSNWFHNAKSAMPLNQYQTPSLVSPAVTALGTKRLASEEFVHNWDNKRLNAGQAYALQQPYPGFESFPSPGGSQLNSLYPTIPTGNTAAPQTLQFNLQVPRTPATATLLGKG